MNGTTVRLNSTSSTTPCQHPGVARSVRQPSTSRSRTLPPAPSAPSCGRNGRRTSDTAAAMTTKLNALNPMVHAGPTLSTSTDPSNGPMMRPLFHE